MDEARELSEGEREEETETERMLAWLREVRIGYGEVREGEEVVTALVRSQLSRTPTERLRMMDRLRRDEERMRRYVRWIGEEGGGPRTKV